MAEDVQKIKINPARVLVALCVTTVILVCLSIWGQAIKYGVIYHTMGGAWKTWKEFGVELLMQAFNMDWEANVPTYVNTILLFIPALLLGIIAAWKYLVQDAFKLHWAILSLTFLYLSIDEAAVLHERLIKPMREVVNYEGYGGIFFFAWVIPGGIAVLIFLLAYLRFFLHLDKKFKILFFLSLGLYIGGILGGEILSGHFANTIGQKNFQYAAYSNLEESLEFFGCSMIIYSLLAYIKQYAPGGIALQVE